MKLLAASAVALLLVLSGCKKSNPESAPAPAQSAAPVQASPRDAGAPAPVDAGVAPSVDAGVADAGAAVDAGSAAVEAVEERASVVANLVAHGCGFDPGSEELRNKDSAARNGEEGASGSKDYDSTYDCAPEDEFDQNCSPDRCWSKLDACRDHCGSSCEDCKKECQPACDTCMGRCETDECRSGCANATDICLSACLTKRRSCRDECESTYRTCSKDFEALWAEKCQGPCQAYVDCYWACNDDEKKEKGGVEACQKACPSYPDECDPECSQRLQ